MDDVTVERLSVGNGDIYILLLAKARHQEAVPQNQESLFTASRTIRSNYFLCVVRPLFRRAKGPMDHGEPGNAP